MIFNAIFIFSTPILKFLTFCNVYWVEGESRILTFSVRVVDVAWSACVPVTLSLDTAVGRAKTAEPIETSF